MKFIKPQLEKVYYEFELLCLVLQIEIFYESSEKDKKTQINAFMLYEKYFNEKAEIKKMIRKQFIELKQKQKFLKKIIPKSKRKSNFVLRYAKRHDQRIEELFNWNHTVIKYEVLKKTTKKLDCELDAELIDYTQSLQEFLYAVYNYSACQQLEKFPNFGKLVQAKYKFMLKNGERMKQNLFEKFYYKCEKKIKDNCNFLIGID